MIAGILGILFWLFIAFLCLCWGLMASWSRRETRREVYRQAHEAAVAAEQNIARYGSPSGEPTIPPAPNLLG